MKLYVFQAGSAEHPLATVNLPEKTLPNILKYAIFLKANGRAEATIKTAVERLKRLQKIANLHQPNQVKIAIANQQWKNSTKRTVAKIYTNYLKYLGGQWEEPKYKPDHTIPFIPTEQEIDQLISAGRPKTATLLQILKETGARIGEIEFLEWKHIDTDRKTIYITAIKGSNSRILPITNKLIGMLNRLPKKNSKVFQSSKHGLRTTFEQLRSRTAEKLNNPRLKEIHFHTLRHWKGTMEYHKTKDILHVKRILGHKSIDSTLIYINIEQALFLSNSDEWHCKTATNVQEAQKLIEAGFQYVTEIDGTKLFRKRK